MAEAQGHSPRASLGIELRAGHVDRDRYGRSPAPSMSHRPVTGKRKSSSVTSHASNPERSRLPELPSLRALENQAVEVPVSVSSATSSTSPRSGSSRVHPYHPVGEEVEGSTFEVVPSIATQAASASGIDESLEAMPIRISNSSPVVLQDPKQVMTHEPKPGCRNGLRFDPSSWRARS